MKIKTWLCLVLGGVSLILGSIAAVNIIIDPFLHYHPMLSFLEYPLKDERYLNDGIARNYDYNAIITGTSMAQNFKPSEFDDLWGARTIKLCFSGGSYKEINDNIERVISYQNNLKYVVRSLDGNRLIYPADYYEYNGYPVYLYDNNPFNDVEYFWNKEVLPKTLAVINYTRAGNKTISWDEYGSWSSGKLFGREAVLSSFVKMPEYEEEHFLSETDYKNIAENVQKNVLDTAIQNPDIQFYVFFPPYSICYWEALVRTKQLNAQLEAEEMAVELLLEADNIHIFAFSDNLELISNLDNYTDTLHYGEWINSDILRWMRNGEHELTKENYKEYFERMHRLEELDFAYDEEPAVVR